MVRGRTFIVPGLVEVWRERVPDRTDLWRPSPDLSCPRLYRTMQDRRHKVQQIPYTAHQWWYLERYCLRPYFRLSRRGRRLRLWGLKYIPIPAMISGTIRTSFSDCAV